MIYVKINILIKRLLSIDYRKSCEQNKIIKENNYKIGSDYYEEKTI